MAIAPGLCFDPCNTFLKNSICHTQGFKLAHLNTCSLVCHIDEVKQIFSQTGFDCIGFSETWLTKSITNSSIKFDNYTIIRHDRTSRGGGVALFTRPHLIYRFPLLIQLIFHICLILIHL